MPADYGMRALVQEGIAVWPGDVPYTREVALDMKQGANLTLSLTADSWVENVHAPAGFAALVGGFTAYSWIHML